MLFPTATPCRSHEVGTVLLGEMTLHPDVAETGVLELPEPCLDALEHQSDDRLLYGLLEGEHDRFVGGVAGLDLQPLLQADILRSEEHTSELQSLMRTSCAVFCL